MDDRDRPRVKCTANRALRVERRERIRRNFAALVLRRLERVIESRKS